MEGAKNVGSLPLSWDAVQFWRRRKLGRLLSAFFLDDGKLQLRRRLAVNVKSQTTTRKSVADTLLTKKKRMNETAECPE